jgi:hypothetical protein
VSDKPKCCAQVPKKLNFFALRPCKRNGTVERDGKWYCSCHDPEKKPRKRKYSDAHKLAMFVAGLRRKKQS